ncbi:MAG: hypothetical protein ABI811_08025 [Acidobacteriota bacterium]
MAKLIISLLLLAAPFWQAKAPAEWTDAEVSDMFANSPWALRIGAPDVRTTGPTVPAYLATAGPIQVAERERERRGRAKAKGKAEFDPFAEEYRAWLEDNSKSQIILAVRVGNNKAFNDSKELTELEKNSVMRVGRRKIPMTGYFPPSSGDPFLRMAFPREVVLSDKTVRFEIYLPGIGAPFRTVEVKLDTLVVDGKLEL